MLFGGSNTCDPTGGPSQVVCLQQALVNPIVQLWTGLTSHWYVPILLAVQENGSPQVTWKLCFKSLQGPSTTSLHHVNIHGDDLSSSPQAKLRELVSNCVAQLSPSQINKSHNKISHWLEVCINCGWYISSDLLKVSLSEFLYIVFIALVLQVFFNNFWLIYLLERGRRSKSSVSWSFPPATKGVQPV